MALQPIDLQTLFTQLDKVAKTQSAQREGLAMQQSIQGAHIQQKTEEKIQSVNESQNMGDGTEKVKDRGSRKHEREEDKQKDVRQEDTEPEEKQSAVFHDPSLGRNIDISL